MKRLLIIAALIVSACSSEPPPGTDVPEAYAVQLPVAPAPGGGAQRIKLPAAALIALKSVDSGDVRVFDQRGRSMAMALESAATRRGASSTLREFEATPISEVRASVGGDQVRVRIERDGQAVGVDTGRATSGGLREAVLLDTRAIDRPVEALFIRAELPRYLAVTVAIEASEDLRTWDSLGEKVLYRTTDDAADALAGSRFALNGADLRGRYLRLSWVAAPGVKVTGGAMDAPLVSLRARIALPTEGAALPNPHELLFSVPFSTRLAAVRITETAPDGPVPVTLFGRNAAEQPWAVLAKAVVRQDGKPAELELSGAGFASYKLEADERTSGFARTPRLDLMVEPLTVIAVFNGQPPFRLAVGNPAANARFLSLEDVAGSPEKAASLPTAKADPGAAQELVNVDPAAGETGQSNRKLILWLALLAGTAVLALAVWRLMRAGGAVKQDR